MVTKIKVGIDINEILRAKWLQFDRYYAEEFGEEGVPKEEPYTYDFFKDYQWKETVEKTKELKEPEDMPDISPIDYQIDEKTGEAPADIFIFKKEEEVKLTPKEVFNRFMYQDYLFEIHGSAPMMYKGLDLDLNKFIMKYENCVDFTLLSVENNLSIPPTLFFLSKINSRFKNISFVKDPIDMWNNVDVLITTDPYILSIGKPWKKKLIKLKRPYNVKLNNNSLEVLQLVDLYENTEFEKIIKYKK